MCPDIWCQFCLNLKLRRIYIYGGKFWNCRNGIYYYLRNDESKVITIVGLWVYLCGTQWKKRMHGFWYIFRIGGEAIFRDWGVHSKKKHRATHVMYFSWWVWNDTTSKGSHFCDLATRGASTNRSASSYLLSAKALATIASHHMVGQQCAFHYNSINLEVKWRSDTGFSRLRISLKQLCHIVHGLDNATINKSWAMKMYQAIASTFTK